MVNLIPGACVLAGGAIGFVVTSLFAAEKITRAQGETERAKTECAVARQQAKDERQSADRYLARLQQVRCRKGDIGGEGLDSEVLK